MRRLLEKMTNEFLVFGWIVNTLFFRIGFFTRPVHQIISSSNSDLKLTQAEEEKKEFSKGKFLGLVLENIF